MNSQIKVIGLLIAFVLMNLVVRAQVSSQVKGIVRNENNEPLAGVSVIVRNTKNNFTAGTTTDSSGVFSFANLPAGGPYSFNITSVGYEPQTLGVYNTQENTVLSLVVKLKELTSALEQVVVVGYGAQKRKDITGSIASLKSSEIKDLAVTRIEQSLLGKIAGVQVKPVSGQPGAAPQIRIRGDREHLRRSITVICCRWISYRKY